MRRTVRLYSPSLVLAGWAAAWAAGATTNGVMVGALVAEAGAIWLHVREQLRRFNDRPQPTFRVQRRAEDRRRTYRDFWLFAISAIVVWSLLTIHDQQDQFCGLIDARIKDYGHRIADSRQYLNSPAARETPALNEFVRKVSIPSLMHQRQLERSKYPSTCR